MKKLENSKIVVLIVKSPAGESGASKGILNGLT